MNTDNPLLTIEDKFEFAKFKNTVDAIGLDDAKKLLIELYSLNIQQKRFFIEFMTGEFTKKGA